jgi:hypothetical protein
MRITYLEVAMGVQERRLFHFVAAPQPEVLRWIRDPQVYSFIQPVSFMFLLNAVLLLPLSFGTFSCAIGLRRGERSAWWLGLVNALTVLSLPGLIVATMGLRYFADAPLFLAGTVAVAAAGLLMLLPLLWARRDLKQPAP